MLQRADIMPDDKTREPDRPGSCAAPSIASADGPSVTIGPPDGMTSPEGGIDLSVRHWLLETLVVAIIALVLGAGIKAFVVQPFLIPSGSMEPTLRVGDRVLADKLVYRFRQPRQGDIVVFLAPASASTDYIKRVIAVGGQSVDVRDGVVYVDGKRIIEPYTHGQVDLPGTVPLPTKVPAGEVWLMGDNRTQSEDSRWFGPQPVSRIVGRAVCVYWPLGHITGL